ncbi:MAG: DNA mismatch repair protein [Pseudomonadota bacterium]
MDAMPAKSGNPISIPDLLNGEPQAPRHFEVLRDKLQFAFSSGESAGALRRLLPDCDVSESEWKHDCFADDLFVDELITRCFRVSAARFTDDYKPPQNLHYFKKVLLHPPAAQSSVLFRQQIHKELLDRPELRRRFEAVYRDLTELREDLDSSGVMSCEYSTRRRIDLLLRIKETVDRVAKEFADAGSGIARIRHWARAFQDCEGYAMLRNFVDYEGRLSSVQLQFQVGVDGTMRGLQIVGLAENTENPFFQSPVARLWGLFKLWWRGSRVGSDELVARVVEGVFDAIDEPLTHVLYLIGHMEFYLASLAFKERCESKGLGTSFPTFIADGSARTLHGLFNPLLLDQVSPPVPCDLKIAHADAITVITGPNSGGKTRLLQSLGLLQLLGQGGLVVPAAEAQLWFRSGMFLSLIQDSTADQKEGRLGTELLRIRQLFKSTPPGALIILDELCSGTNPSEGEEIVLLVLSLLKELGSEAFITTHFLRFAEQLAVQHTELELEFLQVQLDQEQAPTYQFVPGVARSSLAGQTARRLGVTREQLLALMQQRQHPELAPVDEESASAPRAEVERAEEDPEDTNGGPLRRLRWRRRPRSQNLLTTTKVPSILH